MIVGELLRRLKGIDPAKEVLLDVDGDFFDVESTRTDSSRFILVAPDEADDWEEDWDDDLDDDDDEWED